MEVRNWGYTFSSWNAYEVDINKKRSAHQRKNFDQGPAFRRQDWKQPHRSDRATICRATYHGYHHKLCQRKDFFDEDNELCTCIYCGQRKIDRYHITTCKYFENKSIQTIVRELTKAAEYCE